jgi:hypothetical protein
VTSIDIGSAVKANAENCPVSERHRIGQAGIPRLPSASGQFDVVLDHYTRSLSWWTNTAPLFRAVLRRLSAERGLRWTERLVDWLLRLHRTARRTWLAHALVSRFSPVPSYYHAHPGLGNELQREWVLLETDDSPTDWHRRLLGRRTLGRILAQAGVTAIWCQKGGNGLEAGAMRPSPGSRA